jgi:hypothetical protein
MKEIIYYKSLLASSIIFNMSNSEFYTFQTAQSLKKTGHECLLCFGSTAQSNSWRINQTFENSERIRKNVRGIIPANLSRYYKYRSIHSIDLRVLHVRGMQLASAFFFNAMRSYLGFANRGILIHCIRVGNTLSTGNILTLIRRIGGFHGRRLPVDTL